MKIRRVGAELFRADRRTDMTKLIVAFRNFAKVPKNALFFFFLLYRLKQYKTRCEVHVKSKWIFLFGGRKRHFRKKERG
jgi:hypothetical protein